MKINPYTQNFQNGIVGEGIRKDPASGGQFLGELKSQIAEVNSLQNTSDQAMLDASVNGASNIHETMIKVEEADLSLRLMNRVRTKALEAYQEVMRMQF